jgi:hypothetical protein
MKLRRALLGLFAILFVFTSVSFAQQAAPAPAPDKVKQADILRLLELTGARNITTQFATQMMQGMEQADPELFKPDEKSGKFLARFKEEMLKEIQGDEFLNMAIPIYEKAFTREEIRGLIQFYESPLGQKVLKTLPQIVQESMAVGQVWGQNLATRVLTTLSNEFPERKEALAKLLKALAPERP